jgi:hypothetical protein
METGLVLVAVAMTVIVDVFVTVTVGMIVSVFVLVFLLVRHFHNPCVLDFRSLYVSPGLRGKSSG